MSNEILAVVLAGLAGLLGAAVGGAVIYALLNARDARRADRDRAEREAAVHVLEHAVRAEIGGQMREGLETFAQAMEEKRLKEVVKAIELGTLSRMVMVEELQLKALKRVLVEATEADPDLAELLEAAKSPESLPAHAEAPYPATSEAAGSGEDERQDESEGEDAMAAAVATGAHESAAPETVVSPDDDSTPPPGDGADSPVPAEPPAAETAGAEGTSTTAVGPDGDLAPEAVESAAEAASQPEIDAASDNAAGEGAVPPEPEAVASLAEPGADSVGEPEPAAGDEDHRAGRGDL